MSLEQELHSQWAADSALIALVPASRFFTGFAVGDAELPYVVIDNYHGSPKTRTSDSGLLQQINLTFHIYSDDLEQLKAIASAVHNQFDQSTFATSVGTVLSMRENECRQQLHDDGVWHASVQYAALVETS